MHGWVNTTNLLTFLLVSKLGEGKGGSSSFIVFYRSTMVNRPTPDFPGRPMEVGQSNQQIMESRRGGRTNAHEVSKLSSEVAFSRDFTKCINDRGEGTVNRGFSG